MGGDRQREVGTRGVDVAGGRIRGVGRDAGADEVGEGGFGAPAQLGEAASRLLDVVPEHLEVDDRPQPQVPARARGLPAEAAVADGRDARGEALRRSEARNRREIVEDEAAFRSTASRSTR